MGRTTHGARMGALTVLATPNGRVRLDEATRRRLRRTQRAIEANPIPAVMALSSRRLAVLEEQLQRHELWNMATPGAEPSKHYLGLLNAQRRLIEMLGQLALQIANKPADIACARCGERIADLLRHTCPPDASTPLPARPNHPPEE